MQSNEAPGSFCAIGQIGGHKAYAFEASRVRGHNSCGPHPHNARAGAGQCLRHLVGRVVRPVAVMSLSVSSRHSSRWSPCKARTPIYAMIVVGVPSSDNENHSELARRGLPSIGQKLRRKNFIQWKLRCFAQLHIFGLDIAVHNHIS